MTLFLETLITGLVLGSVYAILAGGLTIGYTASGVLNFAYAAIAFFVARLYYYLVVQQAWPWAPSAALCLLVVAPAIGLLLWGVLFRVLGLAPQLLKVVVTIGLGVCLNAIAYLVFGTDSTTLAPGLGPRPTPEYHLFSGLSITLEQLIVYGAAILIIGGGAALLRFTDIGLLVRASVDSEAQASLSGIRTQRVAAGVWASTTFVAGLAGILIAPVVGLNQGTFAALQAAAFAAVVAARLSSLPTSVGVGLMVGVATSYVQTYVPSSDSQLVNNVLPSIPFIFLTIFLIYFLVRGYSAEMVKGTGGVLDRAIRPVGGGAHVPTRAAHAHGANRFTTVAMPGFFLVLIAALAFVLDGVWLGALGLGVIYGVVFLSYTLTAGLGGMLWLCQITFAGIGAFTAAVLVTNHGVPIMFALVAGGLMAALVGTAVGFLTVRMGDLNVALVTLSFGILVENLVFRSNSLNNFGAGVLLSPPGFAANPRDFALFALAVFAILALIFVNLRRSTFGLALGAVRSSPAGARATGLSILLTKVAAGAFGAFFAGIGGGLLAMNFGSAVPENFLTTTGLIWLAVLVSIGYATPTAALLAGMLLSFPTALIAAYLPLSLGNLTPALFGLGAVMIVYNPEGTLAEQRRALERLVRRLSGRARRDEILDGALVTSSQKVR